MTPDTPQPSWLHYKNRKGKQMNDKCTWCQESGEECWHFKEQV
jgi:hypothetical protein